MNGSKAFLYGLLVFDPNQKEQSFDYINNFYSRKDIVGIKEYPCPHT